MSSSPARAVFWNNDPNTATFGVASATGLTDKPIWFPNDYAIYNDDNHTRGTAILLNSEWALTVHHVVQSSAGYNPITTPTFISVYVDGIGGYFADQLFVPADGSELALVHLRGGVNSALNLVPNINSGFDENGRIVQIGGYGYWGIVGTTNAGGTTTGTSNGGVSFHRAYNTIQGTNGLGQLLINENHDATVAANNVLEGVAGSGDSGGPMFAFYGSNFVTQASDRNQWRLVGLTATSAATTSASWNNQSQYTRVANFSSFINTKMASLPAPAPTKTTAWIQDSGNNLYDTGEAKFSVSNSTAAPVVHAKFGPSGNGYTLGQVGDKLTMTATLDTMVSMASIQFRFGMFGDVNGTIPGNVAGGTPWHGYLVANSIENAVSGPFEKGNATGGGAGSWWSLVNPNTGVLVGAGTQATGTFANGAGTSDITPAGVYNLSLAFTRVAAGLQIDWSMVQIADQSFSLNAATGMYQHNATSGVYSFTGSVIDATPASSSWTYDELGYFLYGGAMTNSTIVVDNINIVFVPEPSSLVLMGIAAGVGLAFYFNRRLNSRRRPLRGARPSGEAPKISPTLPLPADVIGPANRVCLLPLTAAAVACDAVESPLVVAQKAAALAYSRNAGQTTRHSVPDRPSLNFARRASAQARGSGCY